MIEPFEQSQVRSGVISFGVSSYGYDMRVAREFRIFTNVHSALVDPKKFDERSFVEYQGEDWSEPADLVICIGAAHAFGTGADAIRALFKLVKPGGRLVYATCSTEPDENEDVAATFLAGHAEFTVDPPDRFPVPVDADGFLRCRPHLHGTDGFTAVRFRRRAAV